MSRLRVRWWLWKRSLGVCPFSLIFASRYENEDGGKVSWWMALSSSLWNWHGQTAARTLCTSVIIYFTKGIWTENKKNITFPEGRWTTKRLELFKMKFLHGFPLNKTQRSATYLPWNSTWTYSWATCESSPWWPCSIAELAVVVFNCLSVWTVQYSLQTWCLQQNVQAIMVDDDWNMQRGG